MHLVAPVRGVRLQVVLYDGLALDAQSEQGDGDRQARAVLPGRAVHQRRDTVLGERVQDPGVLRRALRHNQAVGVDHPVGALAVGQDAPQLVEVSVTDHLPELGAVGRVAQRQVHVAHARQLDVRAVELLVGRVTEVEDRVQAQRGQERGVLPGGVREVAAAEQHPCRTRRPSTVGSPPTSRKLRTPVSSGSVDGACCVTGTPPTPPRRRCSPAGTTRRYGTTGRRKPVQEGHCGPVKAFCPNWCFGNNWP